MLMLLLRRKTLRGIAPAIARGSSAYRARLTAGRWNLVTYLRTDSDYFTTSDRFMAALFAAGYCQFLLIVI